MKRIDVTMNGQDYVFRTNNDGSHLFVGVAENNQIVCGEGFLNKSTARSEIRDYLKKYVWEADVQNRIDDVPMPRLKYEFGDGFKD